MASTVSADPGTLHYDAAPGEANDVVVGEIDAKTWTVRDAGAVIDAGPGCERTDVHHARCTSVTEFSDAIVLTSDMNDRIRSYDESEPIVDPALIADGGPGDDDLFGGDNFDVLDGGGGGHDRLFGANNRDSLTDGDTPGDVDDDVLVGGPGTDLVRYSNRTAPLDLALGDEKTHGERGEGDSLTTIEDIWSGKGRDRLIGDNYDNDIDGGAGADVLRGGLGADGLLGGPGVDSLFCGGGRDTAFADRRADYVAPDCEWVTFQSPRLKYTGRAYPHGLRFRIGCPHFAQRHDDPCSGRLSLRESRGKRRLLGDGNISPRTSRKPVRVKLRRLGRKLAARRKGVRAEVKLFGTHFPQIGWTIRLRVRR